METVSENRVFGGTQGVYRHAAKSTNCDMTFALFLPEEAQLGPVPLLWYLSGLTCTHENAMTKAGAQAWCAEAGIAICFPDTSPRGEGVADDDAFDLGKGAGFYVNATQDPWAPHFRMWDYVDRRASGASGRALPGRHGPAVDHRPFHGRARCAHRWRCACRAGSGPSRPSPPSRTRPPATGAASSSRPISARTRPPGRSTIRRS